MLNFQVFSIYLEDHTLTPKLSYINVEYGYFREDEESSNIVGFMMATKSEETRVYSINQQPFLSFRFKRKMQNNGDKSR